jgi:hypothetical protein
MVHAASEEFYKGVQTELEKCDVILFEGVNSTKTNLVTRIYEIAAAGPRLRLKLQRRSLDLEKLRERMVHADQDEISFNKGWKSLPFGTRLFIGMVGPLIGGLAYFLLDRETLAKGLEPSSLPASKYWADEEDKPLSELIGISRDRYIIKKLQTCYKENQGSEIRIGVLFGASHAEAVEAYLTDSLGFHVASASRYNVFEFDI